MARIKHTLLFCILLCLVVLIGVSKTASAQNIIIGQRIYGNDRYATNIAISKLGWPDTSQIAIIATGEDFPDALSAAPLAGKYNAPILLTNSKSLTQTLRDELIRLGVTNVYIIGGTGVVSQNIQNQLTGMGIEVKRLAGSDRYGTSAAVAREVGLNGMVVVATGEDYPDALSIASWAAQNGVPILLTKKEKLPPDIDKYIKGNNISRVYIIGGEGVVGNFVASRLPGDVKRLAGNDRFGTNLAILNTLGSYINLSKLYLATGNDFPDALSGSSLAALNGSTIILTGRGLLKDIKKYVSTNAERLNEVFFLGGDGVISVSAIEGVLPPVVTGISITMPSNVVGLNRTVKADVKVVTIPSNALDISVTPVIDNPGTASIDSNGNITGITPGNATIKATYGIFSAEKTITVRDGKLIVLDPGHGGWSGGAVPTSLTGVKLTDYREAVLNKQITDKLKIKLESLGYSVVLTREGDTYKSLEDRAKIANDLNADMFISIHHDSLTKSSTGTSAFYSNYKPGVDISGVYVQAGANASVYDEYNNNLGSMVKDSIYTYVKEYDGHIYIMFNGHVGRVSINDVMVYDNTPSIVSVQSKALAEMINKGIADLGLPQRGVADRNLAVTRLTNGVSVLVEVGFISNYYEFQKISKDSFQEQVADKIAEAVEMFYAIYD